MSRIPYRKVPGKVVAGAALVALLGVGAANLTVEQVAEFEGYVPQPIRIPWASGRSVGAIPRT